MRFLRGVAVLLTSSLRSEVFSGSCQRRKKKSRYTSDESLLITTARPLRFFEGLGLQDTSDIDKGINKKQTQKSR